MGDEEIMTKAKDMFEDIMTIDSHFENAGYKGDTVILGVKLQSNIVPIATVIQQANAQIQDIVMELRQEQLDYEDHVSAMMASHRYI